MADDIIINVGSDDEDIQIHPAEISNNVTAEVSGDKYYTDLARSWAISENLVANTDYSSKYYAQQSKQAAESLLNNQGFIDVSNDLENIDNVSSNITIINNVANDLDNIDTVADAINTYNNLLLYEELE